MSELPQEKKQIDFVSLSIFAVLGFFCMVLLVVLYIYNPAVSGFYPKCLFHELTGLHCPGCGGTRAVHSLLHGHFLEALNYNALTVLTVLFIIYFLITSISGYLPGKPNIRFKLTSYWTYAIFWGIMAFWIVRNIPVFPFSLLAP